MFFGKRLKGVRELKKISQAELGKLIGVSKVSICHYEKGSRIPGLETLLKIANQLDVTPNYLLGFDVKVVSDNKEVYKITISKEELLFLSELRKNRDLYNKVLKEPKRSIKIIKRYQTN